MVIVIWLWFLFLFLVLLKVFVCLFFLKSGYWFDRGIGIVFIVLVICVVV